MSKITNGVEEGISRRQTLKAASSAGISIISLSSAPVVQGGDGDTVEIVVTNEGDCVGETRSVSRRWYEHTRIARQVNEGLKNSLSSRRDVHRIGLGRGEQQIDGLWSHQVDIAVTPEGSKAGIPEEIDGIPVSVNKNPRSVETCYTSEPDSIPGGMGYSCPETSGQATLCCRVKDYRNGSWRTYMLGVRHNHMSNTNNCQDEDATKTSWNQLDRDAGDVVAGFQNHDAVLLKVTNNSRSVDNEIVDESGTVDGRVTADGMDCLKSTGETIYKRGRQTCQTSGEIKKTQQEMYCLDGDYVGGVVRSSCRQEGGDSGGPVYYKSGGSLYLINIATARPGDGTYDAKGSSANSMHQNQNFWFGGDPYSGSC